MVKFIVQLQSGLAYKKRVSKFTPKRIMGLTPGAVFTTLYFLLNSQLGLVD
jgi:hypothetical protein